MLWEKTCSAHNSTPNARNPTIFCMREFFRHALSNGNVPRAWKGLKWSLNNDFRVFFTSLCHFLEPWEFIFGDLKEPTYRCIRSNLSNDTETLDLFAYSISKTSLFMLFAFNKNKPLKTPIPKTLCTTKSPSFKSERFVRLKSVSFFVLTRSWSSNWSF